MMTDLATIKTSQVVTLPGWCGDGWKCELKRPSLLAMAASGRIPNPLMKTARKIFYSGISSADGDFAEESKILLTIARAAMVSPTFDELAAAGIELTDEQLIAIFQFTQTGAKALNRFRQLPADSDDTVHGAEVSE